MQFDFYVAAPNLYMVETIDTDKLATVINDSWGKHGKRIQPESDGTS